MEDHSLPMGLPHGFSDLYMWGSRSYGEQAAANIPISSRGLAAQNTSTPALVNDVQHEALSLVKVVLGNSRSLALTSNGELYQWGRRFGASVDDNERFRPRMLLWSDVSWGPERVYLPAAAFGDESEDKTNSNSGGPGLHGPMPSPSWRRVVCDIFSGYSHCVFLLGGSGCPKPQLWAMGANRYGQLGCAESGSSTEPRRVEFPETASIAGFVSVSLGKFHSLAVTYADTAHQQDTTVWAWGRGTSGELGISLGVPVVVSVPSKVADLDDKHICQIAAGESHSMLLSRQGVVYAMGFFSVSCIIWRPVRIDSLCHREHRIVHIGAGIRYCGLLDSDGTPWLWPDRVGDATADSLPSLPPVRLVFPQSSPHDDDDDDNEDDDGAEKQGSGTGHTAVAAAVGPGPARSSVCPRGHSLSEFRTHHSSFWCDDCNRRLPQLSRMFGCRQCNFDRCVSCVSSSSSKLAESETKQKQAVDSVEHKRDGLQADANSPTSGFDGDGDVASFSSHLRLVEKLRKLQQRARRLSAQCSHAIRVVDMVCGPTRVILVTQDGAVFVHKTAVDGLGIANIASYAYSLRAGDTSRLDLRSFVVTDESADVCYRAHRRSVGVYGRTAPGYSGSYDTEWWDAAAAAAGAGAGASMDDHDCGCGDDREVSDEDKQLDNVEVLGLDTDDVGHGHGGTHSCRLLLKERQRPRALLSAAVGLTHSALMVSTRSPLSFRHLLQSSPGTAYLPQPQSSTFPDLQLTFPSGTTCLCHRVILHTRLGPLFRVAFLPVDVVTVAVLGVVQGVASTRTLLHSPLDLEREHSLSPEHEYTSPSEFEQHASLQMSEPALLHLLDWAYTGRLRIQASDVSVRRGDASSLYMQMGSASAREPAPAPSTQSLLDELLRFATAWRVPALGHDVVRTQSALKSTLARNALQAQQGGRQARQENIEADDEDEAEDMSNDAREMRSAAGKAALDGVRLERTLMHAAPAGVTSAAESVPSHPHVHDSEECSAETKAGASTEQVTTGKQQHEEHKGAQFGESEPADPEHIPDASDGDVPGLSAAQQYTHFFPRADLLLNGDLMGAVNNDDPELGADVSFLVDGHMVRAHRCLLISRVPYFEGMFRTTAQYLSDASSLEHTQPQYHPARQVLTGSEDRSESLTLESKIEEDERAGAGGTHDRLVELHDCTFDTFMSCLTWIYTGGLATGVCADSRALSQLLVLADLYGMEELKGHCEVLLFRVVLRDCGAGAEQKKKSLIPVTKMSVEKQRQLTLEKQREMERLTGQSRHKSDATMKSRRPSGGAVTLYSTPPRAYRAASTGDMRLGNRLSRSQSPRTHADREVWASPSSRNPLAPPLSRAASEPTQARRGSTGGIHRGSVSPSDTQAEAGSAVEAQLGRKQDALRAIKRRLSFSASSATPSGSKSTTVPMSGDRTFLQWLSFARRFHARRLSKLLLSSTLADPSPHLIRALSHVKGATDSSNSSTPTAAQRDEDTCAIADVTRSGDAVTPGGIDADESRVARAENRGVRGVDYQYSPLSLGLAVDADVDVDTEANMSIVTQNLRPQAQARANSSPSGGFGFGIDFDAGLGIGVATEPGVDEDTLTDVVKHACSKSRAARAIDANTAEESVVTEEDLARMEKPYRWVLVLSTVRSLLLLAATLLGMWKAQDYDDTLAVVKSAVTTSVLINGTLFNSTVTHTVDDGRGSTGWLVDHRPSWLTVCVMFSGALILSVLLRLAHFEHRRMYRISWWRRRQYDKKQSLLEHNHALLDALSAALLRYSQDFTLPTSQQTPAQELPDSPAVLSTPSGHRQSHSGDHTRAIRTEHDAATSPRTTVAASGPGHDTSERANNHTGSFTLPGTPHASEPDLHTLLDVTQPVAAAPAPARVAVAAPAAPDAADDPDIQVNVALQYRAHSEMKDMGAELEVHADTNADAGTEWAEQKEVGSRETEESITSQRSSGTDMSGSKAKRGYAAVPVQDDAPTHANLTPQTDVQHQERFVSSTAVHVHDRGSDAGPPLPPHPSQPVVSLPVPRPRIAAPRPFRAVVPRASPSSAPLPTSDAALQQQSNRNNAVSPAASSPRSFYNAEHQQLSVLIHEEQQHLNADMEMMKARAMELDVKPSNTDVTYVAMAVVGGFCVTLSVLLFGAYLDGHQSSLVGAWVPIFVFNVCSVAVLCYYGYVYLALRFDMVYENNRGDRCYRIWLYALFMLNCILQMSISPSGMFVMQSMLLASKLLKWNAISWWGVFIPVLTIIILLSVVLAVLDLMVLGGALGMLLCPAAARYLHGVLDDFVSRHPHWRLVAISAVLLHCLLATLLVFLIHLIMRLEGDTSVSVDVIFGPLLACQGVIVATLYWIYHIRQFAFANFYHVWRH